MKLLLLVTHNCPHLIFSFVTAWEKRSSKWRGAWFYILENRKKLLIKELLLKPLLYFYLFLVGVGEDAHTPRHTCDGQRTMWQSSSQRLTSCCQAWCGCLCQLCCYPSPEWFWVKEVLLQVAVTFLEINLDIICQGRSNCLWLLNVVSYSYISNFTGNCH